MKRRARLVFTGILKEVTAAPLGNNVAVFRAGFHGPIGRQALGS
jgi:hypothetical protein